MHITNLFNTDDIEFDKNLAHDECKSLRYRFIELIITESYNKMKFHCIDCDVDYFKLVVLNVEEKVFTKKVLHVSEEPFSTDNLPGFMY